MLLGLKIGEFELVAAGVFIPLGQLHSSCKKLIVGRGITFVGFHTGKAGLIFWYMYYYLLRMLNFTKSGHLTVSSLGEKYSGIHLM